MLSKAGLLFVLALGTKTFVPDVITSCSLDHDKLLKHVPGQQGGRDLSETLKFVKTTKNVKHNLLGFNFLANDINTNLTTRTLMKARIMFLLFHCSNRPGLDRKRGGGGGGGGSG